MCYSFLTSIVSYSIALLSSSFAFWTRQYVLGTLIFFYGQIQLSEALIWKGIDNNNENLNKIGTLLCKYTLPTHLFAFGLGIILSIFLQKKKLTPKYFIPLICGIILYLYVILVPYRKTHTNLSFPYNRNKDCRNPNNRLKWPFPDNWYMIIYFLIVLFVLIYFKPLYSKFLFVSFFTITYIISKIYFPHTSSSFWCFAAAICAPLLVVINYYIIKKDKDILC